MKKTKIRPLDFIILLVFIAAAAVSFTRIQGKKNGTAVLLVECPDGRYIYDLSVDRDLKIKGLLGYSYIKIRNGTAFFADSPCPNKLCVQCRPISNNNEWIACMPNQVFIRIEKQTGTQDVDISSF